MHGGTRSTRGRVWELRRDLRFLLMLRVLPPRVAVFQWRAWRMAKRLGDEFALSSSTQPRKLAIILQMAKGRQYVVELGTAQAWTAISLALSSPVRQVLSYDPFERPQPAEYLRLVPVDVRRRVTLVIARGDEGSRDNHPVELLYVDSAHQRDDTIREIEAWRPVLRDGAVVALDDYAHPDFPGVREAVEQLQLDGEERAGVFVHWIKSVQAEAAPR